MYELIFIDSANGLVSYEKVKTMGQKQPFALLHLCLSKLSFMVDTACDDLSRQYGSWRSEECQEATKTIKKYLYRLPAFLIDTLHNDYIRKSIRLYDPRIRLDIYMHSCMKKLIIHDQYKHRVLFTDRKFWKKKLRDIRRIVHLELYFICADVLKVGKYCRQLEHIHFVSPLDEGFFIAYYIIDLEFTYLRKCKSLNTIIVDDKFAIRNHAIISLFEKLKIIKCFHYWDMGRVISEMSLSKNSLDLRKVYMLQPEIAHILKACKLCENLQELSLIVSSEKSRNKPYFIDMFKILAISTLQVSHFKILNMDLYAPFINFLPVKGKFLKSITLGIPLVTPSITLSIGQYCPDLEHLVLYDKPDTKSYTAPPPQVSLIEPHETMFTNLETFHLSGMLWYIENIMLIVLSHSKKIKNLSVHVRRPYYIGLEVNKVLKNVLKVNPLKELRRVFFTNDMSLDIYNYFLQCPHMKEMTFLQHEGISAVDIRNLRRHIQSGNLDVVLNVPNIEH